MYNNLNNLNGSPINSDASHWVGNAFTSRVIPDNGLPVPANNIQAAASYIPCSKGGSKINRKKINKISRQYKMKHNKKTIRRIKSRLRKIKSRPRKIKSRPRSKYTSKKNRSRKNTSRKNRSRKNMRGGLSAPNYPLGYSQYNNNHPISSTYSTGGVLSPSLSALANPVPYKSGADVAIDNLDHNAKNAFGHNVGAGFASRGWW